MNQMQVIEVVKKLTGRDVVLSPMYKKIAEWRDWLTGEVEGFYEYNMTVDIESHKVAKIKRNRTDMFKRACEDWASLLLNELTRFELDDKPSELWLQGADGRGGVLGENDFRRNANELVTVSRWAGTAAFEAYVENMDVRTDTQELLSGSGIGINYLAGDQIIPISSRNGILKEAAFVSDQEVAGKKQQKVSVHLLENGFYTITNLTLDESGKIVGEPVTVRTGSPVPWFSIIRKSGYNRHDAASVFGVSILDGNEDVLKGLDTAFDNFIVDFILGRKMVFMNSSLWSKDEQGAFIPPQMMGTQLFINVGDKLKADQQSMLEEYNPQLRVAENAEGVQRMLDFFSFKVGLGRGFYKLNEESMITTATEYTGSRQTLVRNVAREMIGIEAALKQLMQALLWIGENVLHVPGVKTDADVSVVSNDGYIIDEYTERKVWQEEVAQGLRSKQEYRERFMGETEQEAIEAVAKIKAENPSLTEMLGEVEA